MPVYEYVCSRCRNTFEELVLADEAVACPRCAASEVEKQFSTFATAQDTSSAPLPAGCGNCPEGPGPRPCGM